jgi:hypothetical protein
MKIVERLLSRRALIKRLGLATLAAPVAKLGSTVGKADKRRRRRKDMEDLENIWIGHC